MKKILILALLALLVAAPAYPWTISWDPVTTNNDNTPLTQSQKPIVYEINRDGVRLGTLTTSTSMTFTDNAYKAVRQFTAKAYDALGGESAWSPPYSWTVPLAVLKIPIGFTIVP